MMSLSPPHSSATLSHTPWPVACSARGDAPFGTRGSARAADLYDRRTDFSRLHYARAKMLAEHVSTGFAYAGGFWTLGLAANRADLDSALGLSGPKKRF